MTEKQISLSKRLELLGFTKGNQVTLSGELDFSASPSSFVDNVLVDATEKKSGYLSAFAFNCRSLTSQGLIGSSWFRCL